VRGIHGASGYFLHRRPKEFLRNQVERVQSSCAILDLVQMEIQSKSFDGVSEHSDARPYLI
jgi:hypothetical protein